MAAACPDCAMCPTTVTLLRALAARDGLHDWTLTALRARYLGITPPNDPPHGG